MDPNPKRYKVCTRCKREHPIAFFEGYKNCKDCRERQAKSWREIMRGYKSAGVGQRIPMSDEERAKVLLAFGSACAFCGVSDPNKIRFTRLVHPRAGGKDDLWNVVPSCTSCLQSRKGWPVWSDWYKTRTDCYLPSRYNRIVRWHSQLPVDPPEDTGTRNRE